MPRSPDAKPELLAVADVIIILGAAQNPDGTPGPAMERRVRHGVDLYQKGAAPRLLMSGGITAFRDPESQTMKRMACDLGVNDKDILQENRSRRTLENAHFCAEMVKDYGFNHCLLVTDDFHMPRALKTFESFAMMPVARPVSTRWTLPTAVSYLRELGARGVNPLRLRAYHRSMGDPSYEP